MINKLHHCLPSSFLSLSHSLPALFLCDASWSERAPGSTSPLKVALAKAWQTRPEMVAGRMPPAPPRGTQAAGSWEKTRPADQQLPWRWSSNWPGQCTPPSPRSGHLTLGKLTNASAFWVRQQRDVTLRVLWPYSTHTNAALIITLCPPHVHLNSHFSGCLTYCHGYCIARSQEKLL